MPQSFSAPLNLCNLNATYATCTNRIPLEKLKICKLDKVPGVPVCPYVISFDLNLTIADAPAPAAPAEVPEFPTAKFQQ
jgi:hypothetical protein